MTSAPGARHYSRPMPVAQHVANAIRWSSYLTTAAFSAPTMTRYDAVSVRCSCSISPGSTTGRGSSTSRQTGIAASRHASASGRCRMPEKTPRTRKKKPISLVVVVIETGEAHHSHRRERQKSSAEPAICSKTAPTQWIHRRRAATDGRRSDLQPRYPHH